MYYDFKSWFEKPEEERRKIALEAYEKYKENLQKEQEEREKAQKEREEREERERKEREEKEAAWRKKRITDLRRFIKRYRIWTDRTLEGIQTFSTRSMEPTKLIYDKNGIRVYWCDQFYIDLIGLTKEEYYGLSDILHLMEYHE